MNIVNERVYHQKFGSGTIIEQTETMITVEFNKENGIKKFLYPVAFDSFLELNNQSAEQMIKDELKEIRERETAERQKRAEDEQRRMEEEHRTLLEQKRVAAKRKSSIKKVSKKTINKISSEE